MIPKQLLYKLNQIPVSSHAILEFAFVLGVGITAGSLGLIWIGWKRIVLRFFLDSSHQINTTQFLYMIVQMNGYLNRLPAMVLLHIIGRIMVSNSDKKAAKKLIKLAKEHPDWYSKKDVFYAKMVKKQLKNEKKKLKEDHQGS